ncbi:MAG: hypothetical protein CL878_00270 [Dehalococcoidia bacterium]|nr:hypothetical protein [Dehalococcoidia bacterium]
MPLHLLGCNLASIASSVRHLAKDTVRVAPWPAGIAQSPCGCKTPEPSPSVSHLTPAVSDRGNVVVGGLAQQMGW